jgi:enoyl-CoA hydratase/carnithine racemase
LTQTISLVERLEKPTVAAVNGVATGAGTQLALACDVRLMAAGARFVYREGRLGIIPSHGGVTRLVKLIGLARARDVILGGEELSAEEAHRLGLVTAVVEPDELLEQARERVALMLERSPQAYAAAKRLLWLAASVDLESGMVAEGLAQSLLVGTQEHKHAVEEARRR